MKDGVKKNWEVVGNQIIDYKLECAAITQRIKDEPSLARRAHIASGYLEEAIDLMPRLWFYTWVPKWALVIGVGVHLA